MTTTGLVQDVTRIVLGSELVMTAPLGSVALTVDDAIVFAEGGLVPIVEVDDATGQITIDPEDETVLTGGGLLRVGGDDPNAEVRRFTSISEPDDDDDLDDEEDPADIASFGIGGGFGGAQEWNTQIVNTVPYEDTGVEVDEDELPIGPSTIYLADIDPADPFTGPLQNTWPVGTRVDVWDTSADTTAAQWRALVRADGDPQNTDAIDAIINYPLVPLLPEGTRDRDAGELVILDDSTGDWRVVDVVGRTPDVVRVQAWVSNSTATIPAQAWTGIAGWSQDTTNIPSTGLIFTTGLSAGVATFTQAGLYHVNASATFAGYAGTGQAAARKLLGIFVNDVEMRRFATPETTGEVTAQVETLIQANIGDTLNVRAWHGPGSVSLAVPTGAPHRWQITRLGSAI